MAENPQTLVRVMNADLKTIASNRNMSVLEIAERSLINVAGHLLDLKAGMRTMSLKKLKDQVMFFKVVQPKYFCALLYYQYIWSLEHNKPAASLKQDIMYYHHALKQINDYLSCRQHAVMYNKLDCRYLDAILFTLPPDDLSVYPDNGDFHYTEYFNFYSYCKAKIMAYERLQLLLTNAVKTGAAKLKTPKKKPKNKLAAGVKKITKRHLQERDEILRKIEWMEMKVEGCGSVFCGTLKSVISRKKRRNGFLEVIAGTIR